MRFRLFHVCGVHRPHRSGFPLEVPIPLLLCIVNIITIIRPKSPRRNRMHMVLTPHCVVTLIVSVSVAADNPIRVDTVTTVTSCHVASRPPHLVVTGTFSRHLDIGNNCRGEGPVAQCVRHCQHQELESS